MGAGGTHVNEQMRQIQRGCDVLVATPGRLVDIMQRGLITLRSVVFLVLDEVRSTPTEILRNSLQIISCALHRN